MRIRTIVAPLLMIAALLSIVAVASSDQGPDPAPRAAAGPEAVTAGGKKPILRLKNSRFGKVIFEKRTGLAAYLFTKDKKSKSKCGGPCAQAWPPIKTKGRPKAGKGLKQRDLGTTKRRGGGRMVTYKGHPLYFYVHDVPGEIFCNDVSEYGGRWYVVNKKGKPA